MTCTGTTCCSTDGKCVTCASRECEAIRQQMDELDSLREIVAAEMSNAKALREVKTLLSSLTGEAPNSASHFLSPATELATADQLYRQLEELDAEWDRLYDQWAAAGCSIFQQARTA